VKIFDIWARIRVFNKAIMSGAVEGGDGDGGGDGTATEAAGRLGATEGKAARLYTIGLKLEYADRFKRANVEDSFAPPLYLRFKVRLKPITYFT